MLPIHVAAAHALAVPAPSAAAALTSSEPLLRALAWLMFWPVGYLLLLWTGIAACIAWRNARRASSSGYAPSVTCVCPAVVGPDPLRRCVASLLDQVYPGMIEVVLVSQDPALPVIAELDALASRLRRRCVRVVRPSTNGMEVALRDAGRMYGSGALHVDIDPRWSFDGGVIAAGARPFEDADVGTVVGPVLVRNPQANWVTRLQALRRVLLATRCQASPSDEQLIELTRERIVFRRRAPMGETPALSVFAAKAAPSADAPTQAAALAGPRLAAPHVATEALLILAGFVLLPAQSMFALLALLYLLLLGTTMVALLVALYADPDHRRDHAALLVALPLNPLYWPIRELIRLLARPAPAPHAPPDRRTTDAVMPRVMAAPAPTHGSRPGGRVSPAAG